jgi:exoribonuclease R
MLLQRWLSSVICASFISSFYFHQSFDTLLSKRDSAVLAQEQSAHLFLCVLISDLAQRYGPVIRQAKVVGVLDAAFDVLVPEFGIEKRVHVDQMPIDVNKAHLLILVTVLTFAIRTMYMMNMSTSCRSTGPIVM